MIWTDDELAHVVGALRQNDTVIGALRSIGAERLKSDINHVFKRKGLGSPTQYLRRPDRFASPSRDSIVEGALKSADISGLDYEDDGPTSPQPFPRRDTMPSPSAEEPCRMFVDRAPKPASRPALGRLRTILFVPDTHRPYHCPKAWSIMLAAGRELRPDIVVVLGDFADFYAVSSHDKNPLRVGQLSDEVADVNVGLDELQSLGASEFHYVEGNHEWRLARYIQKNASALAGLEGLTPRELFHIDKRGIQWTDYMHSTKIGHITITHDVGEAGIYAVKRARDAAEGNIVIGHVHSMGLHYSGTATGIVRVGAAFGWLGSAHAGDYIHAMKRARNWTHGFGVGFMEDDGTVHLHAVPIISGRCVVPTEPRLVAA